MSKLKVVKTLKHLNPLFIKSEGICVYSTSYSFEIVEALQSIKEIKKKDLKFSSVMQLIADKPRNNEVLKEFSVGDSLSYKKVDSVSGVLEFTIKGDIVTIWLPGYSSPIRAEFFGEDCEKLSVVDDLTGRSSAEIESIKILDYIPSNKSDIDEIHITYEDGKSEDSAIFTNKSIHEINKLHPEIEIIETDYSFPQLFFSNINVLEIELKRLASLNYKIAISSNKSKELPEALLKYSLDNIKSSTFRKDVLSELPAGFISNAEKFAFFTDREIFGSIILKNNENASKVDSNFKKLLREFEGEIEIGSYVVHEDYGIALYNGIKQEEADGVQSDYLLLEFAESDELFVPINQLKKITKYLGNDSISPKLTTLGKGRWQELKKKVKTKAYLSAKTLIQHMARIEVSKADPVNPEDSEAYKRFESNFEYDETHDQIRSINEVIHDLESEQPMNRLLVGDVGFGKTEVIMRAAFKIIENGGQVAFLAPTTVLVTQHEHVLKERFKGFDVNIQSVSRFKSVGQNKKIIDKANKGNIDILVGTHRLLSSDVKFDNLQLLIVDEEQKFGVKQKEKIKRVNFGTHVLQVSATPIPRSLSMALSSIQDISIITTPPPGRKPVSTEIIFNDWKKVANAIQKEISRGGQVYFIHNRVETIQGIASKLEELIPSISIRFAHGKLSGSDLDKVITDFYLKKFDVLVSTSIIENGLDLPNVNTIIIHNSHMFGLSQLYQMRGRVGRSDRQAYCFLMAPNPKTATSERITKGMNDSLSQEEIYKMIKTKKKKKQKRDLYMDRLKTLEDNQDLGSGFKVASKDLEIRGAGNVLGDQQHGHIATVGYALYIEMLAEAVKQVKNEEEPVAPELY